MAVKIKDVKRFISNFPFLGEQIGAPIFSPFLTIHLNSPSSSILYLLLNHVSFGFSERISSLGCCWLLADHGLFKNGIQHEISGVLFFSQHFTALKCIDIPRGSYFSSGSAKPLLITSTIMIQFRALIWQFRMLCWTLSWVMRRMELKVWHHPAVRFVNCGGVGWGSQLRE